MKAIVVGAGIIGAATAYALARQGVRVTVIDSGAAGASETSFGWINASFFANEAHHRLRRAGLDAYNILCAEQPDLAIRRCGALCFEEQGAALEQTHAALSALSYPVERLDAARIRALEPALAHVPEAALHFPGESAAEPARVAHALIAASGARRLTGLRVTGLTGGSRVTGVATETGKIAADRVVIAAGTGSPGILSSVGVRLPMLTRPGVLVTTAPVTARIGRILVTPHGEVRQLACGRILASTVANHQGDDAEKLVETPDEIGARVTGWLAPLLGIDDLPWHSVSLGWRPVPQDGLPVIGPAGPEGLHVAVMHSGVTLAAITGQVTADEVTGQGENADLLAPFRPQRFQG